jgi:hypothetical protein
MLTVEQPSSGILDQMRFTQLLLDMTVRDAIAVFAKFGVDVKGLYPTGDEVKNLSRDAIETLFLAKLKKARNGIMMKYHQDKTGSKDAAQEINPAYDILRQPGAIRMPDLTAGGVDWSQGWEKYENQPRPSATTETPVWAMAGFSGGAPPSASIYRQNYTDYNFIKKAMWELSGQSKEEWTIRDFDGNVFRNSITVYGSPKIFDYMADAVIEWQTKGGNAHPIRAVFVSPPRSKDLLLIWADGTYYGDNPIKMEHNSFNDNPENDRQFQRDLPLFLDQLKAKNGVTH